MLERLEACLGFLEQKRQPERSGMPARGVLASS